MEKVTGIVESRDVKDIQGRGKFAGQTNQKIALKVNGANYSAFDNAVPADVAERLGAIRPGDEVDLTYEDVPGTWQGKAVTYHNIKDIIKVDRVDKVVAPVSTRSESELPPHAITPYADIFDKDKMAKQDSERKEYFSNESKTKSRSMALAYAKDWAIATKGDSWAAAEAGTLWTTDAIVECAKRFEQYIQTGE